jgi:hypothetical protein
LSAAIEFLSYRQLTDALEFAKAAKPAQYGKGYAKQQIELQGKLCSLPTLGQDNGAQKDDRNLADARHQEPP